MRSPSRSCGLTPGAWREASPPKPGAVFFAGSSSIVKWDLKKSFPDKGYVNVGFGGSQIPDSTHFAPRILAPYAPGTVVFYAGEEVDSRFNGLAQWLGWLWPYATLVYVLVRVSRGEPQNRMGA